MELIDKHEFAKAALDENSETLVVHVTALEAPELAGMVIRPSQALRVARGDPVQVAALQQDKAPTEISPE